VWSKIESELDENYKERERISEQNRNKRKWHKKWEKAKWDAENNQTEQLLTTVNSCDNSDSDSSYKEEKKIKKEREKLSPSQLVEAYEKNDLLVKMIWDSEVVRMRAEYKQRKKSRAYKTINWFLQWLVGCVDTVRFWEPRWDTAKRFRYAINQAEEYERKSLVRNEVTESKYQNYKKTLAINQRQNE
jgi:hypothetical protein